MLHAATLALDDANADAWAAFQRIYTRFAFEWQLVADRVRLETAGWAPDDVLDLLDRLAVIYDELYPPREPR